MDFGVGLAEDNAALYEAPFEYVRQHVKPARDHEPAGRCTRILVAALAAAPRDARGIGQERHKSVSVHADTSPSTAYFRWLPIETLPDNHADRLRPRGRLLLRRPPLPRPRALVAAHGHLARRERPRYTPTTCFETFPLPWPPGQEPADDPRVQAIAAAAKELDRLRSNWLNPPDRPEAELKKRTLTNLYNQRPAWLHMAHDKLDRAVWHAYGWDDDPTQTTEDEILTRLLNLNQMRAGNP